MLLSPKITEGELILSNVLVEKTPKNYKVSFDTHKNLKFKISNCRVMYDYKDDGKITLSHDSKIPEIIHSLIKDKFEEGKFASKCSKDNITLKIKFENLLKEVKDYKAGNKVNAAVMFNDCWEIKEKVYWSFQLVDIKRIKSEKEAEKEEVEVYQSYLDDEEEHIYE